MNKKIAFICVFKDICGKELSTFNSTGKTELKQNFNRAVNTKPLSLSLQFVSDYDLFVLNTANFSGKVQGAKNLTACLRVVFFSSVFFLF